MIRTYNLPPETKNTLQRWYFDSRITEKHYSGALARAFFSKCIYRLPADEDLAHRLQGHCLADSNRIPPLECLNEIILRIPRVIFYGQNCITQSQGERKRKKLIQNLEVLKSLTRPKVTITLDFREDMHDHGLIPASNCQTRWRPNDQGMHAKDGSHPHGCPDRPFAANAEDLIDDPIVTAILKDLAPLVSLLSARGHIIAV